MAGRRPRLRIWAIRVVSTRVLPVPRAGEHQHRPVQGLDRFPLLVD